MRPPSLITSEPKSRRPDGRINSEKAIPSKVSTESDRRDSQQSLANHLRLLRRPRRYAVIKTVQFVTLLEEPVSMRRSTR
jgi:hypothetical protein